MKTLKHAIFFSAALVLTTAVSSIAGQTPSPALNVLSGVTAMELPAKAAFLISQADTKNLKPTTIEVVKAAVGLNPAAAAPIVGSIALKTPAMAPTAAATAVALVPDQVVAIARAAAAAAPNQAGKIVEAICRVLPTSCKKVGDAVAEVVPSASKDILTAISTAIPALKNPIAQALAGNKGNITSVSSLLDQVSPEIAMATTPSLSQAVTPSPMLSPGTPGPPYVPIPVSHQNLDPGSGGEVPPGGRDYSAPAP